jgi:hypothetical protein
VPLDGKFLINLAQWRDHNEELFSAVRVTWNSYVLLPHTPDFFIHFWFCICKSLHFMWSDSTTIVKACGKIKSLLWLDCSSKFLCWKLNAQCNSVERRKQKKWLGFRESALLNGLTLSILNGLIISGWFWWKDEFHPLSSSCPCTFYHGMIQLSPDRRSLILNFLASRTVNQMTFFSLQITQSLIFFCSNTKWTDG